jgi:hypothetical protein
MPAAFRRTIALVLLLPASLFAQRTPAHHLQQATRNSPSVEFHEMVSISGSLEFVLVGVSGLTDTQRDSIERFEQELRDTILRHATPMLRARPSLTPWWSAEQVLFEREVNAILWARIRAMDRLRDVLTRDQQRVFERNELALRDFDLWYWGSYARGAFSLATLNSATTP